MVNASLTSMTGFAARRAQGQGYSWTMEIRSVNGKGLDLRMRLPDWIDGLEPAMRGAVSKIAARGNVTLVVKLARDGGGEGLRVNAAGLEAALSSLAVIRTRAKAAGLAVANPGLTDILLLRGVTEQGGEAEDTAPVLKALMADMAPLLADFAAMRTAEGKALTGVIGAQIDRIEALCRDAKTAAEARRPEMEASLKDNLARVLAGAAEAEPARIAQELALMVVKADVTEEIDRLAAHVAAARELMRQTGPVASSIS